MIFPEIGLLSGHCGQTKLKILKTLEDKGLMVEEIGQKIGLKKPAIRHQLKGVRNRGKWVLGLLELGLVSQSGRGTRIDQYVYSLTDKGRQFIQEIEALFPDL